MKIILRSASRASRNPETKHWAQHIEQKYDKNIVASSNFKLACFLPVYRSTESWAFWTDQRWNFECKGKVLEAWQLRLKFETSWKCLHVKLWAWKTCSKGSKLHLIAMIWLWKNQEPYEKSLEQMPSIVRDRRKHCEMVEVRCHYLQRHRTKRRTKLLKAWRQFNWLIKENTAKMGKFQSVSMIPSQPHV